MQPMSKAAKGASNIRPILQIPRSSLEIALDISSGLGVLMMIFIIIDYWPMLPDSIPRHFGFDGKPDAWSGKGLLLLFPGLGAVLYAGLTVLCKFPHLFNYPWPITETNAASQYGRARTLLGFLETEIIGIFVFLEWKTVQVALGNAEGLGANFLPLFLLTIFITIAVYFRKAYLAR